MKQLKKYTKNDVIDTLLYKTSVFGYVICLLLNQEVKE